MRFLGAWSLQICSLKLPFLLGHWWCMYPYAGFSWQCNLGLCPFSSMGFIAGLDAIINSVNFKDLMIFHLIVSPFILWFKSHCMYVCSGPFYICANNVVNPGKISEDIYRFSWTLAVILYVCWDRIGCFNCFQALLSAIGVGEKSATVIGATFQVKRVVFLWIFVFFLLRFLPDNNNVFSISKNIQWFLRDLTGMLGGILFTFYQVWSSFLPSSLYDFYLNAYVLYYKAETSAILSAVIIISCIPFLISFTLQYSKMSVTL